MSKAGMKMQRLTKEVRDELTRRVIGGERVPLLAAEFGVTKSYVYMIRAAAQDPERFRKKAEAKLAIKLTRTELARLREIFTTSTPEEQELIPAVERWKLDHGFQLVAKLFGKKPSMRAMRECMGDLLKRRPASEYDPMPRPPRVKTINQIDPELAKDPTYVAYIQSPVYQKIAWREYELALADWKRRHPDEGGEDAAAGLDVAAKKSAGPAPAGAGQRVGKHAKSKGSRFTPPKRRGKKR